MPADPINMVCFKQLNLNGFTHQDKKIAIGVTTDIVDEDECTDLHGWRLVDDLGRQTWHYLHTDEELKAWPQSIADKHHLGLPLVAITSSLHLN